MSTKIYNGYKIKRMNLMQLSKFSGRVKADIKNIYKEYYGKLFTELMVSFYDKVQNGSTYNDILKDFKIETNVTDAYFCAYTVIRHFNDKIKTTQERNPLFDFDTSIHILPVDNKILALLYTDNRDITKLWESYKEVSSYYYFDNTDKPERISDKNWEQRAIDWEKAMPTYVPNDFGFTLTCDFTPNCLMWDEIKKYIPSDDFRTNKAGGSNKIIKPITKDILYDKI